MLSGCRILPFPVHLHSPAAMAAAGRAAAGPLLRPGPSLTSAAGQGTAGASGHGITSRPSAVSPCHPVGLFGASCSPSLVRCQPWHLMELLARLFEMNKHMVPMETLELKHFTAFSGGNKTCFPPRFKRGFYLQFGEPTGMCAFCCLLLEGARKYPGCRGKRSPLLCTVPALGTAGLSPRCS